MNDPLDDSIAPSQANNLDIGQYPLETTALMSQVDDNDYLRMVQPSAKSKVEKPSKKIQTAWKKSEAQQRQDYMFTLFYREQDLQQQRIGAIQNSIRGRGAPPEFGRSVEPIQTRGGRLCPSHYCCSLPPPLIQIQKAICTSVNYSEFSI